jgi:hypothetical protein
MSSVWVVAVHRSAECVFLESGLSVDLISKHVDLTSQEVCRNVTTNYTKQGGVGSWICVSNEATNSSCEVRLQPFDVSKFYALIIVY